MDEISRRQRSRKTATRFDNRQERIVISALVALGILVVLVVTGVLVYLFLPDAALTLQLGGMARNETVLPRNTDIWMVNSDGTVRFATVFFPVKDASVSSSETFTVTGPYVTQAQDILESKSFGATSISSEILPGVGNDSTHVYEQFTLQQDPSSEMYGLDMLTTNSPYITPDAQDANIKTLSMGAELDDYYAQSIVAIAFAPGTQIDNLTQPAPSTAGQPTPVPEILLRPYRRVNLNSWLVYYFDTTSLTFKQTIRIQYRLGSGSSNLDIFEVDAKR
jgi:hypothetical protein